MKTLTLFALTLLLSVTCFAQRFYGGGLATGSVVGEDRTGNSTQFGGFGETAITLQKGTRFDFTGLGILEHAPKAFTTSTFDVKLRPEIRAFTPMIGPVRFFAGGGVQFNYLFSDQFNKAAFNPVGTIGGEIGSHTLRLSRLFKDGTNLNENQLQGWRFGYDFLRRFTESKWGMRVSAEYNLHTSFQPSGPLFGRHNNDSFTLRAGLVRMHR